MHPLWNISIYIIYLLQIIYIEQRIIINALIILNTISIFYSCMHFIHSIKLPDIYLDIFIILKY